MLKPDQSPPANHSQPDSRPRSAGPGASPAAPRLAYRGGPLAGLRVIELADESGQYAGKLLADQGADVIKVEPQDGCVSRWIPPFFEDRPDPEGSLDFWHANTNKRSITLNPRRRSDWAHFRSLLEQADVLLTSYPPAFWSGVWLGVEPGRLLEQVCARLPHLIVASITPFGPTGPRAGYRATDSIVCALAGLTYLNGWPDGPPLRPFGPQAAHCAGYAAAIGILAAVVARGRTGRGQRVGVSTQEAVLSAIEHVGPRYLTEGIVSQRPGTRHWAGGSWVATARDGRPVLLSLAGDWDALVNWLEHEGLAGDLTDPRYRDPEVRHQAADHVVDLITTWAGTHDLEDLVEGAQARRIPFAPVLGLREAIDQPQLRARGFFVPVDHPELGRRIEYPGVPIRRDGAAPPLRRAPRIGEHTVEVLEEIRRGMGMIDIPPLPGGEGRVRGREGCRGGGRGVRSVPPLAGLRVADFTWVIAGPHATRILGDLGAEVIKIERVPEPDLSGREARGRFDLWGNLNRNKRSVALDLSGPEGRDLARQIIARSDLVIDNFSPRVMRNLGLDAASLRAERPDLIVIALSGAGQTGPMADWVTFGPTIQALTGHTWLIGEPGAPPAGYGFAYVDLMSGYAGALAALAAIDRRRRTGDGAFVDLAQWEVGASLIGPAWLDLTANGREPGPRGNLSPDWPAAPDGVYPCAGADRWCAITCRSEAEWEGFRTALGRPGWTAHPRFASLTDRIAHRADLDALVAAWTRARPAEEVMETLQAAGIPAGVVQDARDLVERDSRLRHRRHWLPFDDPGDGSGHLEALPIRLSDTPLDVTLLAPHPGEDTDWILSDLIGLSAARIADLRARRIVGGGAP